MSGSTSTGGSFSNIGLNGSVLGTVLGQLMLCDELEPGSPVSYQQCKVIYTYHPLGAKIVDTPVNMALSQPRDIVVDGAPDDVAEAFNNEWSVLNCTNVVSSVMKLSRIYGLGTIVYGAADVPANQPIPYNELASLPIYFNILDPLNTAGSITINQDPNSPLFQKPGEIVVQGSVYHLSRTCVVMNEQPLYIDWTTSAFGYVGRSVYQRCLFPLKSFLQTMLTDDMVSQKAGVLIAKIKPAGSIADRIMAAFTGIKRALLQGARTYNVLSINPEEDIESLNLQNIDGAMTTARDNIIKNIALSIPMPSKILADEVFVGGFGEGVEDAKHIAHYIDGVRADMSKVFTFLDNIVMARAWSPEFFQRMQQAHPDIYGGMSYAQAFYGWRNNYKATWPSLLTEPESKTIKVEETKLKAIKDILEIMMPALDPVNKARAIVWAAENFNANEMLFETPLELDGQALLEFCETQQEQAEEQAQAGMMGAEGGGAQPGAEKPNNRPQLKEAA